MDFQNELRKLLFKIIDEMRVKHPTFSLRMFAKQVEVPVAALSLFLRGKRNFSKKMCLKIARKLDLSHSEYRKIEECISQGDLRVEKVAKEVIDAKYFFLLSDPIYYSLLCLMETKNFLNSNDWIASQLNKTSLEIIEAKKLLTEIGYIKEEEGILRPTDLILTSTDNIPNEALRSRHIRNMDDAKKSLINFPVDQRYFAFETLSFDEQDLPIVQNKMNQLFDDLILLSQRGVNKNRVYEFCSLYFPRNKESKETDDK